MTFSDYLSAILEKVSMKSEAKEMDVLRTRREEIEILLRTAFPGSSLSVRYGGSKVKGTMLIESFDLDLLCYFAHDEKAAGESIEEIFGNIERALAAKYAVEPKGAALRLLGLAGSEKGVYFHIDVVPGRFVDGKNGDAWIHTDGKKRLKTNLDTHVAHVRESGRIDEIKLMKHWKLRNGLHGLKTFILELLVIKLLKGSRAEDLAARMTTLWSGFVDKSSELSVEDPANPGGNDLSESLGDTLKARLVRLAETELTNINNENWEAILGPAAEATNEMRVAASSRVASSLKVEPRPWLA